MVEPVEPDERIWQRIKAKMPEAVPVAGAKPPEPEPEPLPESPEPEPTPEPGVEPSAPAAAPAPAAAATPMDRFEAALAAVTEPLPSPETPEPSEPLEPPEPAPASAPQDAVPRTLVAPALAPATAAPPPPVQAPVPSETVPRVSPLAAQINETAAMRRRLWRWRAFATLMTLVVLAIAALVGAWRLVPDQLPPLLQPVEVMQMIGVTVSPPPASPRPTAAPPESEYDE
jgi:hypothetical protein